MSVMLIKLSCPGQTARARGADAAEGRPACAISCAGRRSTEFRLSHCQQDNPPPVPAKRRTSAGGHRLV
ncbi:MAG: hypothetical protein ACK4YU_13825, partial [Paracoccus sp. (in: a-proteobacteria)]